MFMDDGTGLSSLYTNFIPNSGATTTSPIGSGGGVAFDPTDSSSMYMYMTATGFFTNSTV